MTEPTPHGVPHQINIYTRDRDRDITGFGRHKRALVFLVPSDQTISVRVDHVEADRELPWPTLRQVLRVCNGWQRMHAKHVRLRPKGQPIDEMNGVTNKPCRFYEFTMHSWSARRAVAATH